MDTFAFAGGDPASAQHAVALERWSSPEDDRQI
jgi:hypothetical protein